MKSKLVRFVGLSLIAAAAALPVSAAGRCGCDYCQTVPSETPCATQGGQTTCGAWLAVTLCPPVG